MFYLMGHLNCSVEFLEINLQVTADKIISIIYEYKIMLKENFYQETLDKYKTAIIYIKVRKLLFIII